MCHKGIVVLDTPGLPEPIGQVHIGARFALFLEIVVSLNIVMFQTELGGSEDKIGLLGIEKGVTGKKM